MNPFEFFLPTRLVFGTKSFDSLDREVARFGAKALLVSDPVMADLGVVQRAVDCLGDAGIKAQTFTNVVPNPTSAGINEAADAFRDNRPDVVVGIGGGSAIDSAKALAVALTQPGDVWECINEKGRDVRAIDESTLPIIAVPTTSGTGAEVTCIAVLVNPDTHVKRGLYSEHLFPRVALIDPELMLSAPPRLTATTGIDALSHAIEACIARDAHAYTQMTALEAIRLIAGSLPTAVADGANLEARSRMAWGATLAGIAISNGDVTLVHALGHPLSGRFNIGHGETIAMGLPCMMRRSWMLAIPKFALIADALGASRPGDGESRRARNSVAAVEELIADVGLSLRLSDFGVRESDVENLAKDTLTTMAGCLACHPKACGMDEISGIYREML